MAVAAHQLSLETTQEDVRAALDIPLSTLAVRDRAVTASLGAVDDAITLPLEGRQSASFTCNTGSLIAAIVPELSFDGGSTWTGAFFRDPVNGLLLPIVIFLAANPQASLSIVGNAGATHARVRVSSHTSGAAIAAMRAVMFDEATQDNRRFGVMASTNGTVSTGSTANNVASIAYLFHPAANARRIEISRIDIDLACPNVGASATLAVRLAFIAAENAAPGGTVQTARATDQTTSLSTTTFRTGATGAPTRVAGDLASFVFTGSGQGGTRTWRAESPDRRLVLPAAQPTGVEVRTMIGTSNLSTAAAAAVTFFWTEASI